MSSARTRQATMGAVVGAIIAANVFLFMPFTLYVGNSSEFTVSFGAIFKVYLPLAVFVVGMLALFALLLPRSLYLVFLSVIGAATLLLWLQGNLLVWDYGLLDGRSVDWSANVWRGRFEVALWVIVLAVAGVGYRQLSQPIIRTALAVFFLQTAVFFFNWIQFTPELSERPDAQNAAEALSNIHRFSSRKNVVHIIADGFQSDIFAELTTQGELGARLATALDGFTFFREHMGVFSYTHMSVPAILTGRIYRNHIPIKEHLASTVGGKSILSVANDAGYELDLAVPAGTLASIYSQAPYSNLYRVTKQEHINSTGFETYDSAKLLDLTLFRVSPHFLKKHIHNDQLWFVQSFMTDQDYKGLAFFSHAAFF